MEVRFENVVEMGRVCVAQFKGDLDDGQIGIVQVVAGVDHLDLGQILDGGTAEVLVENSAQVCLAVTAGIQKVLDLPFSVFQDVRLLQKFAQPAGFVVVDGQAQLGDFRYDGSQDDAFEKLIVRVVVAVFLQGVNAVEKFRRLFIVEGDPDVIEFQKIVVQIFGKTGAHLPHEAVPHQDIQHGESVGLFFQQVAVFRPYEIGGVLIEDLTAPVDGVLDLARQHNGEFPVVVIVQIRIVAEDVLERHVVFERGGIAVVSVCLHKRPHKWFQQHYISFRTKKQSP